MKTTVALILNLLATGLIPCQTDFEITKDEKSVRDLIEKHYLKVMYYGHDSEELRNGLHPEFNMYYYYDHEINKTSLDSWISRLKEVRARKRQSSKQTAAKQRRSHEFKRIDVHGYMAIAVFDVF